MAEIKTLAEVRAKLDADLPEDAKDRRDKIRVNGAKLYIRQIINEFEGDVKEAMGALAGTGKRGGGAGRVSPKKTILATLAGAGSMTDLDCFKTFNKGPAEMREIMKYGIREVKPSERVWIEFEDGTYTVVATGEEAPEDWDGYLPSDESEAL